MIGPHDPFQRAYVQPALRANPRARPEQPFPPNQLGRDILGIPHTNTTDQHAEEVAATGATLRLKGMNQQDRRLVNRWWNDQLQKCQHHPILPILIGEECGSLTLGRRSGSHFMEMASPASPATTTASVV